MHIKNWEVALVRMLLFIWSYAFFYEGIQGFPTLKFFPKGSTEPVDYKGGRSLDDFVAYLKENTGVAPKMAPKISYVKELTDENFRSVVFNESAHVFVKFYAPW